MKQTTVSHASHAMFGKIQTILSPDSPSFGVMKLGRLYAQDVLDLPDFNGQKGLYRIADHGGELLLRHVTAGDGSRTRSFDDLCDTATRFEDELHNLSERGIKTVPHLSLAVEKDAHPDNVGRPSLYIVSGVPSNEMLITDLRTKKKQQRARDIGHGVLGYYNAALSTGTGTGRADHVVLQELVFPDSFTADGKLQNLDPLLTTDLAATRDTCVEFWQAAGVQLSIK